MYATNILTWILVFLGVVFIVHYNWKRRFMYYYSSKMPGPIAWPIVGNVQIFFGKQHDYFNVFMGMLQTYPPVFRTWFGNYLHIFTSRPEDAEVILNSFLEKASFYEYFIMPSNTVLVAAPVSIWKPRKKIINPTFHTKVIESFHETFVKHSKNISRVLQDSCGREETDLFPKFWTCTMDILLETLFDSSPIKTKNTDLISWIKRIERIMVERSFTLQLHIPFIWKLSTLYKEAQTIKSKATASLGDVLDTKVKKMVINKKECDDDAIRRKRFIYLVLDALQEGGKLTRGDTLDEMALMLTAASETTAITITSAMVALALYPDVQEKIYQELISILGDDIRDPTVEDMRKMEYLERVVKETMRLFPAIPFISRSVDKDVPLDPYVFPAGSNVVIPIIHIHRRAELWPDPFKFDPDRFLPEEVKKRHLCAFIPFSIGARNCIGFKYGMESMKVMLAAIVKSVKIKALNYNSLEDIQLKLHLITEPKGYNVTFERRI